MAREFSRTQRVAGQMQRELAQLIQQEIRDPRLGMVTVSDVEVSRDLSHANVYITVLGEGHDVDITLGILNKAAGFLRHALGQRIKMRALPALHFFYDASVERGTRLSALINQAVASDRGDKK